MPKSWLDIHNLALNGRPSPVFSDAQFERMMAGVWDGAAGPPGVDWVWLGDWDATTVYFPGDIVALAGSLYIAVLTSQNTTPPSGSWDLVLASGGGAPAWGALTGILSNQTDLQAALDAKQPLDADLTTLAGLTATTDNFIVSASSAWASRTPAQAKTSLALVKGDVGLGSVDNTSDAGKPISTATQTALDGKQPLDSDLTTIAGLTATTDNFLVSVASAWASRTPAQAKTTLTLVKGDVGLGNVDNTSDANKPVSTATQTALDLKANLAGPTFTGVPAAPTAAVGTNTTQLATTAYARAMPLDTLAAPTDNTTLDATTVQHGLMMKYPGGTSNFLRADGTFASPGAASVPDIVLSILAPAVDESVTAGYSAVLVRSYKIASGKKLTIGLAARMRIL